MQDRHLVDFLRLRPRQVFLIILIIFTVVILTLFEKLHAKTEPHQLSFVSVSLEFYITTSERNSSSSEKYGLMPHILIKIFEANISDKCEVTKFNRLNITEVTQN